MVGHNRNRSFRLRAATLCAVLALGMAAGGGASAAPSETVLHAFAGPPSDGAGPGRGLTVDSSGNLYGTTGAGGAATSACPPVIPSTPGGCGTVFKLSPGGSFTLLHSFAGPPPRRGCSLRRVDSRRQRQS